MEQQSPWDETECYGHEQHGGTKIQSSRHTISGRTGLYLFNLSETAKLQVISPYPQPNYLPMTKWLMAALLFPAIFRLKTKCHLLPAVTEENNKNGTGPSGI